MKNTFKVNWNTTWLKLHTLQCFTQSFMIVADSFFGATAEWQRKVQIGLLTIMIGTNRIHPQDDFFIILVLKLVTKKFNENHSYEGPVSRVTQLNLVRLTMWLCSSHPTKTDSNKRHNTNRFEEIILPSVPQINSPKYITFSYAFW